MKRMITSERLRSLATQILVFFVAGAVVPLVLLGIYQVTNSYATQRSQTQTLQREIARSAASTIDAYLMQIESDMALTARSPGLRVDASSQMLLNELLTYDVGFDLLALMDGTGREVAKVARYRLVTPGSLGNQADSPAFQTAREGTRYLGPVSTSEYNEPLVTLAVPVRDVQNRIVGVLSAEVNLKYMWDVIARIEVGATGYAYVVDDEGWLIAHHNPSLVLQGQDLSAREGVRDALQGQDIPALYKGLEGKDVIGHYQPLRQADWFVLVETPSQEALSSARRARTVNIAVIVGTCVLATFLGWYVTRIVIRPLRRLQKGAAIVGGGDLAHRIDIQRQDEIGALAGAFNDMAAQLQEMVHTLEQREDERVRLQQEIIEAQKHAIQELSTPIIPVMETARGGIIVMPLIGSIDTMRAGDITRSLLAGIREHQAKVVILDITGVPLVDSGVASHLNKTIMAARLKGAHAIVTGISDSVAETIVDLGIDWSQIETLGNLQMGLRAALARLGQQIK